MKKKFILICLLLSLLLSPITAMAKEPEWLIKMKSVKLLSDTRENINRFLGDPVDGKKESYLWYFDFPEGRMAVSFETHSYCMDILASNNRSSHWKVPEWTVTKISFFLDKHVKPSNLKIDLKDFTSKPIYDQPETSEYTNENLGIKFGLNKGKIESITFLPEKTLNNLRCS